MSFLLLFSFQAKSQGRGFFDNSFVSFGAGPDLYLNKVGTAFDVSCGKWIVSTMGLRGQFSFNDVSILTIRSSENSYSCLHFDILFDPVASLNGRRVSRNWRSWFDVGIGFVHRIGDNDFCGVFGIGFDCKIKHNLLFYASFDAFVFPSGFDSQTNASLLSKVTAGVSCDILNNGFYSRSRSQTNNLYSDWYMQIAFGTCSFNYRGAGSLSNRLNQLSPIVELNLAKRYTSLWSARVSLSGVNARSVTESFSYLNMRGDLILHTVGFLTNRKTDYPNSRNFEIPKVDVCPYLGASLVSRFDDVHNFLFSVAAGSMFIFCIDIDNQLYLDARYVAIPSRMALHEQPQGRFSVGLATLSVGYSHLLSKSSFNQHQ